MSKKSELPCKCRLTMPRGGTRATFCAESVEDAQRRGLRILKKKALPKGWKLTVDGPAGACYPKADPTPRPLQVGDRVKFLPGHPYAGNPGDTGFGVIVPNEPGERGAYQALPDGYMLTLGFHANELELVEPAPQPKAEEETERDFSRFVTGIQNALGLPFRGCDELVDAARGIASQMDRHRQERDAARQEIATLKAEVERLKAEVNEAHEAMRSKDRMIIEQGVKLSDAQAIARVGEIIEAMGGRDWSLVTLMAQVVKGPAA